MFLRKLAKDASAPSDDPKFQTWLAQALNAWSWKKRVHVMLCHNHNDLMAFTTPAESPLRNRQDNRKVSHGHEDVAVIKEPTPEPGHTVNLLAMPRGGNSEPRAGWRRRSLFSGHGQSSPERGLFSCPMPQRQPHVVKLDGARRYRRLVQSKIVVTRPSPIFRPLHPPFCVTRSASQPA